MAISWTYASGTATGVNDENNTTIKVTGLKTDASSGLSVSGTSVVVSKAALGEDEVSISVEKTSADGAEATTYTLALGSDTKNVASGDPAWSLDGTTATYGKSAKTNYTIDSGTIKYSSTEIDSPVVYATVEGVSSSLKGETDEETATNLAAAFKIEGSTITVNKLAIDNTKKSTELTLENGADESGNAQTFALKVGADVNESKFEWDYKGTKAEYKETVPIQFEVEGTKIKASTNKAQTSTVATVSGFVKDAKEGLTVSEGKITISTDLFGTSKITLKNGKYVNKTEAKFEFDVDGEYTNSKGEVAAPVWIVKGTTAQYYDADSLQSKWGYNVGKTDIEYTKPQTKKGATAAITLTNLKSDKLVLDAKGKIAGIDVTPAEGTVTISKELFNEKNISLTGDDYSLAFNADDVAADKEAAETAESEGTTYDKIFHETDTSDETYKIDCPNKNDGKGKAEIMQVVHKGYTLSSNAKAILYGASDQAKVKIAEVSGLDKKGGEGISFDSETGAIVLDEAAIGTSKKITISGDAGYTLALGEDTSGADLEEPEKKAPAWDLTKTTATYKAVTPAGYSISEDGKTLTLNKELADVTATVNGINAGLANIFIKAAGLDEYGLTEATEAAIKKTDAYKAIATEAKAENDALTEGKKTDAELKAAIAEAQAEFVEECLSAYKEAVADEDDGLNKYVEIDTENKTITLAPEALGTSKITVKSADGYKLALGEGVLDSEAKAKEKEGLMWSVSGATATYQNYRPAYYTIDPKGAITCTKGAPVDKKAAPEIVLSGLKKNLVVDSDGEIAGIKVNSDGTVKLTADVLAETNVKVTKGNYKIVLDGEVTTSEASAVWATTKKAGSYDLMLDKSAGYELASDGKSVTYVKSDAKPSKIGTISGLSGTTLTLDAGDIKSGEDAVITVDETNKKITISNASVLGNVTEKNKVTFSGKEYALALDGVAGAATYVDNWIVDAKKKTASLRRTITSDGLAVDATGKTIIKMTAGEKNATFDLFTITGLNSNIIASALEAAEYEVASDATDEAKAAAAKEAQEKVDALFTDETDGILSIGTDNSIVLKEGALGSSAVKLSTKGNYTLDLDEGVAKTAGTTATEGFVVSGTTATFKSITTGYYAVDAKGTSIAYVAPKSAADAKIFEITGLAKGLTVDASGNISGISVSGIQVTIGAAALGTTDVALTGSTEHKFKLDSDVQKASTTSAPVWTVKKTSATLTQQPAQGYTLKDNQNITYTKGGSAVTLATLSGLSADLEAKLGDDKTLSTDYVTIDTEKNEISLNKALLTGTTSVKLKNGKDATYKLGVGDDAKVASSTSKAVQWYIDNTTAKYINCEKEHYEVSTATKTAGLQIDLVKASPVDGATAEITVEGIKKGTTADSIKINSNDKTVTIADAALNKKEIKLTTSESGSYKDYTLAFSADSDTGLNDPVTEASWSTKGSTAKLNQDLEKGYTPSSDGKSISFLSSNKKVTVATIKGVSGDPTATITDGSTELNLDSSKLTKAVTVDGTGYTFTFDKNFASGNTVTGSKNADKININSAGITVTGGKGADIINLGKANRTTTGDSIAVNTLVYASGDSPETAGDVITNYQAGDVIKVNLKGSAFSATAEQSDSDVVVTLTKSKTVDKITLTGAAIANVAVVDKDNKAVTVTGVPAATSEPAAGVGADIGDLLYSDNYNLGAQLGEIMSGNSITDFSVGDLDTDSATALTKQQPTIVASTGK